MSDKIRGWAKPTVRGATKYHCYMFSQSLCGKWWEGSKNRLIQEMPVKTECCKVCLVKSEKL